MAEATHGEVHRHPAPTGFIRKYIFSLDHKVIGIQYILLALTAVVVGMIMSVLDAREPELARNPYQDHGNVVSTGCAGWRDDA